MYDYWICESYHISGLITPLSLLALDKKLSNFYNELKHIIFLRYTYNRKYFIDVKFKETFFIYILIKVVILIFSSITTRFLYELTIR